MGKINLRGFLFQHMVELFTEIFNASKPIGLGALHATADNYTINYMTAAFNHEFKNGVDLDYYKGRKLAFKAEPIFENQTVVGWAIIGSNNKEQSWRKEIPDLRPLIEKICPEVIIEYTGVI